MFEGFDLPFLFGGNSFAPDFSAADPSAAIPQPLPEQVAQHLAMQGVKPGEFMANPKAFEQGASPLAFPPAGGQRTNPLIPGSSSYGAQPAFAFPDRTPLQPKSVQTSSFTQPEVPTTMEAPTETPGYNYSQSASTAQPAATQEMSAKGTGKNDVAKNLTDTLKGVQALQPPTPQRVYTPSPVNPGHATAGAVKGNQLAALLQLMAGKQQTPQVPLPLGAVLAGRA